MKSILDQIKAVKEDAKQAIDEMLQLRQELDEFEEYNPYPADRPFEERFPIYRGWRKCCRTGMDRQALCPAEWSSPVGTFSAWQCL